MHLEPANLLQILFLFLTLFGLLLVRRASRFSSLGLLLCLQAVLMLFNFLEETGITRDYYLLTPVFTLGFGPAIYLFVRHLTFGEFPPYPSLALHFLPMVLALPFTYWPQLVIALGSVSQACYLAAAVLLVRRYHRAAYASRSDAPQLRLDWLTVLLGVFVVMMLQDLLRLNLQPYAPLAWLQGWYFFNTTIYFVLTAYLILKAVHQPELYEGLAVARELRLDLSSPTADASRVDTEAAVIFAQLDEQIRSQALFKQPRLGLRDLASVTGLQEKTISWAINQGAGKNLSDYINGLRVEAFCQALDPQAPNANMLDLAMAVGFGAKSTFNSAFKKETGLTPSQYLQRQNTSKPA
ncbi:AraC family transcriptional regulator [Marinimicrobium sp. ABcell2]|uniref:helix-turn-helix domain-containing protein n=1 Tax=Marinimicrobium sp. ABcell2 TaxID=3069751 RepID=UPI0027B29379|nr:helix-turn-helix domain-containing protein [Marinimicrobium sp. ABcell2]MDQ2077753.1 helix-turn-helix domain-containing protein [Marinimicrobium sp. ABcell2]